jgi:hypothetical protein
MDNQIADLTTDELEELFRLLVHLNRYGQLADDIREVQEELATRRPVPSDHWQREGF